MTTPYDRAQHLILAIWQERDEMYRGPDADVPLHLGTLSALAVTLADTVQLMLTEYDHNHFESDGIL